MDVFTAVETLQELGIQGRRIHVVLTVPEAAASCFSDPQVEQAVMAALEKAEVQVYHDCLLAHMNQGEPQLEPLTSVTFTTSGEPLHLQCGVSQRARPSRKRTCAFGEQGHPSHM